MRTKSTIKKVVRKGKVAVLYSPAYGAGWYSWNLDCIWAKEMLFCPEIVQAVLEHPKDKAGHLAMAERIFPDACILGAEDGLHVAWIPQGKRFRIHEYDGSEEVVLLDEDDFITA